MTILLQRLWQKNGIQKPNSDRVEPVTVGNLTVFDINKETNKAFIKYRCYTIENGGASSAEANKDRRILPGQYRLGLSVTKVPLPREYTGQGVILMNPADPSFLKRRIFIHAGNYPQDTEGCILLQSTYDTSEDPGYGRGSMRATKAFYDIIHKKGVSSFTLLIRDEFDVDPASLI